MAKISDSELAALNETGPLLRFAAERVKDLRPKFRSGSGMHSAGFAT
jgi:hypothetical protein